MSSSRIQLPWQRRKVDRQSPKTIEKPATGFRTATTHDSKSASPEPTSKLSSKGRLIQEPAVNKFRSPVKKSNNAIRRPLLDYRHHQEQTKSIDQIKSLKSGRLSKKTFQESISIRLCQSPLEYRKIEQFQTPNMDLELLNANQSSADGRRLRTRNKNQSPLRSKIN